MKRAMRPRLSPLEKLLQDIRACQRCADVLPLGPRPMVRADARARILIIGQAPGLRVHQTGLPWNDPSGDRLRLWMGIDRDVFYDASRIAIMPMGMCYPGRNPRGGDLPPRPECAPLWFPAMLPLLPKVELTLLVGAYAQRFHLSGPKQKTLTDAVAHWRDYLPSQLPLPHPSFRNNLWLRQHPWFEEEALPWLQRRVRALTGQQE